MNTPHSQPSPLQGGGKGFVVFPPESGILSAIIYFTGGFFMGRTVLRGLVGLLGVLGLLIALQLWLNPAGPAAKLGVQAMGPLGLATIRADMGGFFGAVGILAVWAAFKGQGKVLTAPLLLVALALTGRVIAVAMDGLTPDMVQPMVTEAVLVVAFAAGRRFI